MSPSQTSRILDSHIHLWPSTSTQPANHGWMTPGHQLAKRHGTSDYKAVTAHPTSPSSPSPSLSFIYVETDRNLPSSAPDQSKQDSDEETRRILTNWAKQPLEEIKFLRRIVDESPQEGDGFESGDGTLMSGAVLWAPFHLHSSIFNTYLRIAEEVAGPKLWARVVGFRYLLQGKAEGEVRRLVESEDWVENIVSLGAGREGRGWTFDVGVDTHRDGVEQLECVVEMIETVRRLEAGRGGQGRVRFILNHLCKPSLPLPSPVDPTFLRWRTALSRLSPDLAIYMKLSGAFNEFDGSSTPSSVPSIMKAIQPFFDVVLASFPGRLMFGSDWPVCNVGGPHGEQGNWRLWFSVVEALMEEKGLKDEERNGVWWKAGSEAYGIE